MNQLERAWVEVPVRSSDGIVEYLRYPVDTLEQRELARAAMRSAGVAEVEIFRGVGSSWVGGNLRADDAGT